jgi:hypothetical protein
LILTSSIDGKPLKRQKEADQIDLCVSITPSWNCSFDPFSVIPGPCKFRSKSRLCQKVTGPKVTQDAESKLGDGLWYVLYFTFYFVASLRKELFTFVLSI